MDCSLPGFCVHGILQATVLDWVAISFSRGLNPGLLHCRQTDALPSEPPGKHQRRPPHFQMRTRFKVFVIRTLIHELAANTVQLIISISFKKLKLLRYKQKRKKKKHLSYLKDGETGVHQSMWSQRVG